MSQKVERCRVARPLGLNHFDHRGNYVTGFFNDDRIPDPDVFPFNLIFIMQRRARNRAPAHQNRFENSDRCENSSATNLNFDVEQFRFHALGGVFVSDRPARRFCGEAESLALLQRVNFDHGAVGFVRKIAPNLVEIANRSQDLIDRIGRPPIFVGRQPELFEQREDSGVKIHLRTFDCASSVKNHTERALRRDLRIEMFQRTGCSISRVREQR